MDRWHSLGNIIREDSMGVVNNEIRIAGLEATTAGIMTSVNSIASSMVGIEANIEGVMTSVNSMKQVMDKYNRLIFKTVEETEESKTGSEIFDIVLSLLYDNAGVDTDFVNLLSLSILAVPHGGDDTNLMQNANMNPVTKASFNPSGTGHPSFVINGASSYTMRRVPNGTKTWTAPDISNILTTTFDEYYIYLMYELKQSI